MSINNGLLIHTRFAEGTGTDAFDSSGNGRTGVLTNGAFWADGVPKITTGKKSCETDGSNDFIRFSGNLTPGNFTMCGFIYIIGSQGILYGLEANSPSGHHHMFGTNTSRVPRMQLSMGSTTTYFTATGSSALSANTWYHMAIGRNASNAKIWIDGVDIGATLANTNSGGLRTIAKDSTIAKASTAHARQRIQEFRMYNRLLTDAEVLRLSQGVETSRICAGTFYEAAIS